ncbi:MAG: MmgE/PrpD family protein [Pseudomonadota bacterium]
MIKDPIYALAEHVAGTSIGDISDDAITAAKIFILDTLGVGISGSSGPMASELVAAMRAMGTGGDAHVWCTGELLPACNAALCNAYMAHCQEYDCVHEGAVAHVMTCVLPAALAVAQRQGGVTGARLLEAVILGVDVAASLGLAASSGLRFFRPGTVGAFGGVAAAGKILEFDAAWLVEAFSIAYGQVGGTMQAHTEGSGLLAMQMAFNARNAVTAVDLAAAGFTGPHNILTGDFGYFRLIEGGGDPKAVIARLGKDWLITGVAHKPFPSGRATHGILDGCLRLQHEHRFAASDIAEIKLTVPPLIQHLVGRPPKTQMAINYARLCARYVLACAMHGGGIGLSDFTLEAYLRADRQDLAERTRMVVQDDGDPNALVPIGVAITLKDGTKLHTRVEHVYGSPENPMTRDAHLAKFRQNCWDGTNPLPRSQVDDLIGLCDDLHALPNIDALLLGLTHMTPG